ncbi:DUF4192 domain-containing protein [Pseudonocardia sp. CA-107938]|uniref:DUF4192 domain-containing protein n=1 Tax=Pseudonocardia sp. CA-107938 TaxID=3240021 RepID=UPI003D8C6494
MTTFPSDLPASRVRLPETVRRGTLRSRAARQQVGSPGELVAALPGLLGFHPRASVLAVALRGPTRHIELVVRSDLPDPRPDPERLDDFATHLVAALMRAAPDAAAIVVVPEEHVEPDGDPPWSAAVTALTERLREVGIPLHSALWASGTRAGDTLGCYERCRCRDEVPQGAAGAFAAGAALGGIVVHDDREALLELVEPVDPLRLEHREQLIAAAIDQYAATGGAPEPSTGWAVVAEALADAARGTLTIDDERAVALAVALGSTEVVGAAIVRMAVLAREGAEQERAAAEQLWAALTRESPEPEAAAAASLLAVSALLRGDGALANVALDRAEEAWPGYLLSSRLRAVAALGVRPEEFRDGVLSSFIGRW